MRREKNLFKRLILFFIGMIIIQTGVAVFLRLNLGSDPFTVFNQGLGFCLKITTGQANMIILAVFIIIIICIDRRYLNIGTAICVFGVGPVIDLAVKVISHIPLADLNLVLKIVVFIAANFIIAVGFSILAAADLGVAPNDNIYFIVRDKFKLEYKWARIIMDMLYLIIGFLLGGIIGIGTIISAVVTGPFVQFCMPYGKRVLKAFIKDDAKVI